MQVIGGLGAGFAIIFSLLAWQLSKGPLSIKYLTEYLERAVNSSEDDFKLKIGDTILTWAGWHRALDIRVLDVQMLSINGKIIGIVPEVAFSLSGDALMRGEFAPSSIELFGPRIKIRRDRDGSIDIGLGTDTVSKLEAFDHRLLDVLMAPPTLDQPLSFLSRVTVAGGAITVNDQLLKKKWNFPVADIRLNRGSAGLAGEVNLVLEEGGLSNELFAEGTLSFSEKWITLGGRFRDVTPAMFSSIGFDWAPLKALNMPFSGDVQVAFQLDGDLHEAQLELKGQNGRILLPLPLRQDLDVAELNLTANFVKGSGIHVENLDLSFAAGTSVNLPSLFNQPKPLRRIVLEGGLSADQDTLQIRSLMLDSGGPIVQLSADLSGIGHKEKMIRASVSGGINSISVSKLTEYWPPRLAPDPRAWVTERVQRGLVENVIFDAELLVGWQGNMELLELEGGMRVTGAMVDYLPPMPPVINASADIRFDSESMVISMDGGNASGLSLASGRIVLTGLDQADQFADVDLEIAGSVTDKLVYIDNDPFNFTSALNLSLGDAGGYADTRLKLFFMLEKNLSLKQVKVWARSEINDVRLKNVFLGHMVESDRLDLRVDARGMDVFGNIKIAKIPARLKWRENFEDGAELRSSYNLKAQITDFRHVLDLGIDIGPLSEVDDFFEGGIETDITFIILPGGDSRLKLRADLSDAAVSAPAMGWAKPVGEEGEFRVTMDLENELITDIPQFHITAKNTEISGKAMFALDGTGLERIEFSRVLYGRTDMRGALIPKVGGGWEAGFHGASFDLSQLWEDVTRDNGEEEADHPLLDKLTLAVEFDRVWINKYQALEEVSGTFARAENVWQTILMNSRAGGNAVFDLSVKQRKDGGRDFLMHADDAGHVLGLLDLYPNMRGGTLRIAGAYDDASEGKPLKGIITVKDYRIINAPALAHVLSIMSLTGILDALQGEGLSFDDLEVPFKLAGGTFELSEAKATGSALGFTASGKVFRHADIVDLAGTVVPAYVINSAFGRIPVLGKLFTGGEKGSGVFAATYTMTGPLDDPTVAVNPLSALAPGFLRNVFGILSGRASGDTSLRLNPRDKATSAR